MKKLSKNFFLKNSIEVAKKLLGKILIRKYKGYIISGKIIETECYRGKDDCSSKAYNRTDKKHPMFGEPGILYIYLCYGKNYLLNIITEKKGKPGAVFIRALQPLSNLEIMKKLHKTKNIKNLTNGPGKLTDALFINKKLNGEDITKSKKIYIVDSKERIKIKTSSRIGIKIGLDKKWRFYIADNPYVSKI